jgi:DNA processing protein
MALLSNGSIIVEAGAKSGTRHQGWEAIRLGRPLFFLEDRLQKESQWLLEMQDYGAIAFRLSEIDDWLDEFFPAANLDFEADPPDLQSLIQS